MVYCCVVMSFSKLIKMRYGLLSLAALAVLAAMFFAGRGEIADSSFSEISSAESRDIIGDNFLKEHERLFAGMEPSSGNAMRMIAYPGAIEYAFPNPEPRINGVSAAPSKPAAETPRPVKALYQPQLPAMPKGAVKVAIIIDDMGMSYKWTQGAIDLGVPMTMAFLPYAKDVDAFTKDAISKGHELIIHTPMEPMNGDLDLGPIGLRTGMDEQSFKDVLEHQVLTSFKGYVGINNHMGSRLTQDREAMGWVMEELKPRGLFFVDSKTIGTSVAAEVAAEYGVPFAERDVFLDHVDEYSAVMSSLEKLEATARRKGYAIAIGHPKENTVSALRAWLPGALERGVEVVPVASLLTHLEEAPSLRHTVAIQN